MLKFIIKYLIFEKLYFRGDFKFNRFKSFK